VAGDKEESREEMGGGAMEWAMGRGMCENSKWVYVNVDERNKGEKP
jgi:hypothetical protein